MESSKPSLEPEQPNRSDEEELPRGYREAGPTLYGTLYKVLHRTDPVIDALKQIHAAVERGQAPWSGTEEVRIRIATLTILEEMATAWGPNLQGEEDTEGIEASLKLLRIRLETALEAVEEVEADLASLDQELDPTSPGGAKAVTGERGPRPSRLTVSDLLEQRTPEWDGTPPFPGKNNQETRDWLHSELKPDFPPDQIDPRVRGPLSMIINNLIRLQ